MYVSGQQSENVEFINNRLIDTHGDNTAGTSGVLIWNANNVKAYGNYFHRTQDTAGMTSNAALNLLGQNGAVEIQNNYFDDMIIKLDGTSFNAYAIKGNVFTGRIGKSNILEFTTIRTLEEVEFLEKNNTYSPEGLGYVAYGRPARIGDKGYATIQEAIDAAVEGDIIIVDAGTYEFSEQLNIAKPISFVGKANVVLKVVNDSWNVKVKSICLQFMRNRRGADYYFEYYYRC